LNEEYLLIKPYYLKTLKIWGNCWFKPKNA